MQRIDLSQVSYDPELSEGARNAVDVCLRLSPRERITIITDIEALEIGAALLAEAERVGSESRSFVLEEQAPRPLGAMPRAILDDLARSQVSIFAASALPGELVARFEMTEVVNRRRVRHGHMVNINKRIMMEGMRADFGAVDELSTRLIDKARKARSIAVKSRGGTDLVAEFSPDLRWVKTSGIISSDKWGNLPGGEIFTSPATVNGVFVVDGVVGDYLCRKFGDLRDTPLTIEINDARIVGLRCANKELTEEFARYTSTDENSNRVGEFAIGTNTAVKGVIGHILQDEKIPGVHVAFGHPYSEHTGQEWRSRTHIDCVGRDFHIWMDGEQVMAAGQFRI
jgi:aminopeptidase